MTEKTHLKRIEALGFFTDEMLGKLLPYSEWVEFGEGKSIFKEGDTAKDFYMLLKGKVLLEQRISPHITVTVYTIKPGQSFGVSSLLEPDTYQSDAICAEPSEILVVGGEDLLRLLEEDHSMGYYLMKKINMTLYRYLQRRTDQFLRSLDTHPDIFELSQTDTEDEEPQ